MNAAFFDDTEVAAACGVAEGKASKGSDKLAGLDHLSLEADKEKEKSGMMR